MSLMSGSAGGRRGSHSAGMRAPGGIAVLNGSLHGHSSTDEPSSPGGASGTTAAAAAAANGGPSSAAANGAPSKLRRSISHAQGSASSMAAAGFVDSSLPPVVKLQPPPDYEQLLAEYEERIEEDPLHTMLRIPDDDIEVHSEERLLRTARSTVPPSVRQTVSDLFVSQCVDFYTSEWGIVQRKYLPFVSQLGSFTNTDLPEQVFEVDVSQASTRERRTTMSKTNKRFSTGIIFSGNINVMRFSQGKASQQTLGRKKSEAASSSKWKKRFATLHFLNERGTLVLDLLKDEKSTTVKETIELDSLEGVEPLEDANSSFKLTIGEERIIVSVDSPQLAEQWMLTLEEAVEEANHSDRVDKLVSAMGGVSAGHEAHRSSSNQDSLSAALKREDAKIVTTNERLKTLRLAGRPDMFRVYSGLEDFVPHPPEPPKAKPLEQDCGLRFSVECQSLQFALAVERDGRILNPEPFFCTLALYDIRDNAKVSEDFHFDLNDLRPEQRIEEILESGQALTSKARTAIFAVHDIHPEVYLLLRVEKTLQGDINSAVDTYIKGAESPKSAEKQMQLIQGAQARLSKFRMPFAWAARPVFTLDNRLDTLSPFGPLYKQEPEKLREEDMLKYLADIHKRAGKMKTTTIPGSFEVRVQPQGAVQGPTVTASLVPVREGMAENRIPMREVQAFPTKAVLAPYTTYENFLYVYPTTINVASKKTTSSNKARNIACRVDLLETDEMPLLKVPTGGKCMYGRSSEPSFTTHVYTAVLHHNRSPDVLQEIKIELPAKLSPRHHLLFSFYHISIDHNIKGGGKKKRDVESLVGFSFLPLLDLVKPNAARDFELPIANAGANYPDGALLPAGYMQERDVGMGQRSGPNIKYLDNGKPCFKGSVRLCSTVFAQDDHLLNFFKQCERHNHTAKSDQELCICVKALHALTNEALFHHLPVLFTQLLNLLPQSSSGQAVDQVSVNVVRFLIHAATLVQAENKNEPFSPILLSYVEYVFKIPPPSSTKRSVHGELARYLGIIMRHVDPSIQENFLRTCWFFLRIMGKSMAQELQRADAYKVARKHRHEQSYRDDLASLVQMMVSAMRERVSTDLSICTSINAALGRFMHDCFAVMDRGFVFSIIQWYLSALDAKGNNQHLILCKFDFLHIICSYEHYIPLNLPIIPESIDAAVSPLSSDFIQCHFLAGVLMREVRDICDRSGPELRLLRRRAIATLRFVIARHDMDPRYKDRERRARIALLYFPLVHVVLGYSSRLFAVTQKDPDAEHAAAAAAGTAPAGSPSAGSGSGDQAAAAAAAPSTPTTSGAAAAAPAEDRFDFEETRDLLICFLHVLKNMDQQLIIYWWNRHGVPPVLFEVLALCLNTFRYVGKEKLWEAAVASPAVKGTGRTSIASSKRLLEEQYSTSSLMPSDRRSSALGGGVGTSGPARLRRRMTADQMQIGNLADGSRAMLGSVKSSSTGLLNLNASGHSSPGIGGSGSGVGGSSGLSTVREGRLAGADSTSALSTASVPASDKLLRAPDGGLRSGSMALTPSSAASGRRFRFSIFGSAGTVNAQSPQDIARETLMEANLATEVGVAVLQMLEIFFTEFGAVLRTFKGANAATQRAFSLLFEMLRTGQSEAVMRLLFATVRFLVTTYADVIFNRDVDYSQQLCLEVLRGCNSSLATTRDLSTVILYTMLRQNLPRMSLDVTIALSKIAGNEYHTSDEELRRSLTAIAGYARGDAQRPNNDFPTQVVNLTVRLRTVLVDTAQMKKHEGDPEMLLDLQYRVARSYANSPELRVTWLESMAKRHLNEQNWSEAAMCVIHAAAAVAEQLKLQSSSAIAGGCEAFTAITPNVLEEAYRPWEHVQSAALTGFNSAGGATGAEGAGGEGASGNGQESDWAGTSIVTPLFSEKGLVRLLQLAISFTKKAQRFELVSHIYRLLTPILERDRKYEALAAGCRDMEECYNKIIDLNRSNRRRLATYFRVGLYGSLFSDLNGHEFIYKEPNVTPLSEISLRLKALYSGRFGAERVELITDSNKVQTSALDAGKAYIQVTHVEPYFELEPVSSQQRVTHFEQNHNVACFFFETPFTESGKAHGAVTEQFKRKTILRVEDGLCFPYVKKRLLVVDRKREVMEPLDNATEEIRRKVEALRTAVMANPPDLVMLQMQLQGVVSLQVNAGPLEIASAFLGPGSVDSQKRPFDAGKLKALRGEFRQLAYYLHLALQRNGELIQDNQREYHEDLRTKFATFKERLSEFVDDVDAFARSQYEAMGYQHEHVSFLSRTSDGGGGGGGGGGGSANGNGSAVSLGDLARNANGSTRLVGQSLGPASEEEATVHFLSDVSTA